MLLPPDRLRSDGLLPTLANISEERIGSIQRYIDTTVRPHVLFNYRGDAPDAFSAFLGELLHLSKTRLPKLDSQSIRRKLLSNQRGPHGVEFNRSGSWR